MFKFLRRTSYSTPTMALLLTLAALAFFEPSFLRSTNVVLVLYYAALVVPCVVGMYTLILIGLFDLSVGSTAALAGIACAVCSSSGHSAAVGIIFAILCGLTVGVLNWALVSLMRIPALVATLITMAAVRGVALLSTSGRVVGGLPSAQSSATFAGFPIVLVAEIALSFILVIGVELLAQHHFLLRRLYYLGSNRDVAVAQGISGQVLELLAFVSASIGAAAVGTMQTFRTLSASPLSFQDLALDTIAACVIGGMSLSGGRGRASACGIGLLVIVSARNFVNLVGVDVYWQDLAVAVMLLFAVVFDRIIVSPANRKVLW